MLPAINTTFLSVKLQIKYLLRSARSLKFMLIVSYLKFKINLILEFSHLSIAFANGKFSVECPIIIIIVSNFY